MVYSCGVRNARSCAFAGVKARILLSVDETRPNFDTVCFRERRRALIPRAPVPLDRARESGNVRIRKLLLVIAAALTIAIVLTACGGSEEGQTPDDAVAPDAPERTQQQSAEEQASAPEDPTLNITVPSMERISNAPIPDTFGEDEEALKNFAGIHLQGTGFPWQDEANVYIAGHRLGYPNTPSFLAFWDIDNVVEGDQIFVTDANGREYTYEVFQTLEVDPTDLFVTEPLEGRNILTLQSCTLPDYERRVVVQAELQDTRA
jgi:sortase A